MINSGVTQAASFARGGRYHTIQERFRYGVDILIMLMFSFVSLVPFPALAAAENMAGSARPVEFVWDVSLAGQAISVDDWLAGGMTVVPQTLPPAPTNIAEGMKLKVLATAYSSTIAQTDDSPFITASGTFVHQGTLAANFLPLGTKVLVNGQKYTVEDRLHERYNGRLVVDIWYSTEEEAINWGVRRVHLEVLSLP